MGKPFGTEVARCPLCGQAIGNKHPYTWCAECGKPLPPQILAILNLPKPSPVPTNLHCATCGAKAVEHGRFCHVCGAALSVVDAPPEPEPRTGHGIQPSSLIALEVRLKALEDRLPNTNLLSRDFWTRALAVIGHGLAGQLALLIILLMLAFVLEILTG